MNKTVDIFMKAGLLIVFCFSFTLVVNAQTYNNGVSGIIYNRSGQTVSDMYVELLNEYGSTITRTRTNGSGIYSFRRLAQGRYRVKVLNYNTNYREQVKAVSLISISAIRGSGGIQEQIDFYLDIDRKYAGPLAVPEVIFAQSVPKDAEKQFDEALKLLADDKKEEGFEKLKQAIETYPTYFAALDRLGTEYVVKGYYRPAYVLLSQALDVNPRSYSSRFGLGVAQFRLKLINESVGTLKKAVETYNNSYEGHLWLGIVLHADGDLKSSESSLIKANKLSKNKSPKVHWQLARLYKTQKRFDEAADALVLYLKYSKKIPDAHETKVNNMIATLRKK